MARLVKMEEVVWTMMGLLLMRLACALQDLLDSFVSLTLMTVNQTRVKMEACAPILARASTALVLLAMEVCCAVTASQLAIVALVKMVGHVMDIAAEASCVFANHTLLGPPVVFPLETQA
uniref:Secreted protein n=1 Tax=Micrurus corallinus TaxID=54390 RepID=A0A2D4FGK6_MICCO